MSPTFKTEPRALWRLWQYHKNISMFHLEQPNWSDISGHLAQRHWTGRWQCQRGMLSEHVSFCSIHLAASFLSWRLPWRVLWDNSKQKCKLVSWCFKPRQQQRIISGLAKVQALKIFPLSYKHVGLPSHFLWLPMLFPCLRLYNFFSLFEAVFGWLRRMAVFLPLSLEWNKACHLLTVACDAALNPTAFAKSWWVFSVLSPQF